MKLGECAKLSRRSLTALMTTRLLEPTDSKKVLE